MKNLGMITIMLAIATGIGFLHWLVLNYCIYCFGSIPIFLRF